MPKLIFLLLIREVYLFIRNLLGLIIHPYKTFRKIRREEDFSQAFLLSSWPVSTWLVLAVLFVILKFFFHPVGILNNAANFLFILYSLFTLGYSLYLAYWLIFYWKISSQTKGTK